MPGHKRNKDFGIIGSEIDITEIDGFDNLHDAKDILLDIENELTNHYKSKKSYMLVNGSTVGILAAIFAVCNEDDKIIIARNCHKSVYNACYLRKLKVVYIEPEFDYENGYYTRISDDTIYNIEKANPDAKAIVITSPTYEGNISNIKTHIPLIIDAAHGAHLGMATFPAYPKGDIVISSLHKTLPALTQTAVANIYNEEYVGKIKFHLDIFESSSPSYVLMNSVAKCCDYLKNKDIFSNYCAMLWEFRDIELSCLRLMYSDDFGKIVISCVNANINGYELGEILRNEYKIEAEMVSKNYIILMTSVADTKNAFDMLKNALISIDAELDNSKSTLLNKPPIPNGTNEITITESYECDISEAVGKKSNEFIYAYPPDIPIIVPNEIITKENLNYLIDLYNSNINIVSDSGLFPNKILTKYDE